MPDKPATSMMDDISKFFSDNSGTLLAMLAAGGVGAGTGAMLTDKKSDDEAPEKVRNRRIMNALLGAGLGAGAAGLIGYGFNQLGNALPIEDKTPMEEAITGGYGRAALGLGAAGVVAGSRSIRHGKALTKFIEANPQLSKTMSKADIVRLSESKQGRNVLVKPKEDMLRQTTGKLTRADKQLAAQLTMQDFKRMGVNDVNFGRHGIQGSFFGHVPKSKAMYNVIRGGRKAVVPAAVGAVTAFAPEIWNYVTGGDAQPPSGTNE